MILTRAQCLGLWSLASELPIDSTFEILGEPDGYGHLLIVARGDSPLLKGERRYKLLAQGGREELEVPSSSHEAVKAEPSGSGA